MATSPKRRRSPAKPVVKQAVSIAPAVAGHQGQHQLFPVTEVERDGIAMGVLSDGTPYLHLRGLARLCGIDHAALVRLTSNWPEERAKPRGARIAELLEQQAFKGETLHLKAIGPSGETHAYTDAVCMALLEYYAFDAKQGDRDIAVRNYRLLARKSFRAFIYDNCGYNPDAHIPESWRTFHERILLNDQVPRGYFSVFREIADVIVHMIKGGCPHDKHTILDISVGQHWSTYWAAADLDAVHGERQKHPHNYPDWFPQSAVNPVEAWIYPDDALGEFRRWLYATYVMEKLPPYIDGKVKKGLVLPARADALLLAVQRQPSEGVKQLPPANKPTVKKRA
jgi:hypothetical protein